MSSGSCAVKICHEAVSRIFAMRLMGLATRETALSVSSGFVRIAGEKCDLVALRVAKVANKEVRSVRDPEARLALVGTAGKKRCSVKIPNLLLIARLECDHGTVSGRGRTTIKGWFDVEVRQNGRLTWFDGQHETQALWPLLQLVTKGRQDRGIKPFRPGDVIRTNCDIGNHAPSFFQEDRLFKRNHCIVESRPRIKHSNNPLLLPNADIDAVTAKSGAFMRDSSGLQTHKIAFLSWLERIHQDRHLKSASGCQLET